MIINKRNSLANQNFQLSWLILFDYYFTGMKYGNKLFCLIWGVPIFGW